MDTALATIDSMSKQTSLLIRVTNMGILHKTSQLEAAAELFLTGKGHPSLYSNDFK
jgi:hypothetical protein